MTSWRIVDSFFYPLGLRSFSSSKRTVFVAYSFDSIQIFKFKKETEGSGTLLDKTLKIQMKCFVDEVIVLADNTFVRGKNGELFFFVSSKTLKKAKEITDVRCLSSCGEDNISVIRVTEQGNILLEIYCNQQLVNSYDISFDPENFLHNSWKDDQFRILSLQTNEDNLEFLILLLNKRVFLENIVHIFTISNQLFACIEETDGHHEIIHLDTLASQITALEFIYSENVLLILLKSGVLKMFYKSKLSKVVEFKTEILKGTVESFTASVDAFFYSNDASVNRLTFNYDETQHTLEVSEESKPVRGAVAMTWVAPNKKIVYLTENNNFFTVKFRKNKMDDSYLSTQMTQDFVELTQDNIEVIQNNLGKLELLTKEPERLKKAIIEEQRKQKLLETSKKNPSAFIEFVESYKDTLEANINLRTWAEFDPKDWNLLAIFKAGNENTSKTSIVKEICTVHFPQSYLYKGLTVSLELIARIDVGGESVCVQVPIKKIEMSYLKLFSKNRIGSNEGMITITLPIPRTNIFESIDVGILEYESDRTSFLGSEVLFQNKGDFLTVKSSDPMALYVVKSLLLKSEGPNISSNAFIKQEMDSDLNVALNSVSGKSLYEEIRGIKG
ncbi:hypothetical protein ACFFRR_007910 [Megaselia abdita]